MGNEAGRPLPSAHPAAAAPPGGGGAGLTATAAGAVAGATLDEGGGEGEAIPYTSYSLPVPNAKAAPTGTSTSPVATTSIPPPSAAKPQRAAPNRDEDNIITIKPAAGSGPGTLSALLEPEEKELANLHKFLPILRSSVGGSSAWFSQNLKEIESMDVKPLVTIGREFQEFCRRNSLAVVHQQRALGSQLRSVEGLCSKTQQTCLLHANEAKFCEQQLRDLTLLPDQISKANMLVRDIVLATQRLNALLPPTEQLASLHLSPLQATLGNGKATMGVTDSQPSLQNDVSPTCRVIVKSGMATDQGRRYTMEDAHVLLDDVPTAIPSHGSRPHKVRFYAVYDGHGGSQSALFSGKLLHKLLIEQPEFSTGDYEAAMRNAYRLMDQHILTQSDKHGWNDGTTAVTILMVDQTIVVGNAGDSESVLGTRRAGADGTPSSSLSAMLLTQNHKPNSPEERSRIEQAGGAVIFGRVMGSLAVSRALGDFSFKAPLNKADKDFVSAVPFVRKMELNEADEIVVIACDGLWDVVTYSEAIGLVESARKEGKSPEEAAKLLVKTALIKRSQDNLTVIVLYLSWPSPPSTTTTGPTAPTTPAAPLQPSST